MQGYNNMALFRSIQTIKKPVEEVFAVVADAGSFASWNPTITASRKIDGNGGLGSTFEWKLRGFGAVAQEVGKYELNKRIRFVPHINTLSGGHRFLFTAEGNYTRIDHELEMVPHGWMKMFTPFMGMIGQKNLHDTVTALQKYIESKG